MDVTTRFSSDSVNSAVNLSWVLLTDWTLALIASIGILFYFNRFIALLVSYVLKVVLWKRHKVRIKVQSVKVSFLGGRIFFKNLSIIDQNQIILMHQGWFTWRYWLTFVKKSGLFINSSPNNKKNPNKRKKPSSKELQENEKLPSRFELEIFGLEHFVYNRVEAFDALLKQMTNDNNTANSFSSTEFAAGPDQEKDMGLSSSNTSTPNNTDNETTTDLESFRIDRSFPLFSVFRSLPLSISVEKGALVIGNENTPTLLVTSYSKLMGLVDLSPSTSSLDYYKLNFKARAFDLRSACKSNLSYKKSSSYLTKLLNQQIYQKRNRNVFKRFERTVFSVFKMNYLRSHYYKNKKAGDNQQAQNGEEAEWQGLPRYLLDDITEDISIEKVEYAKFSTVLDTEYLDLHYYFDFPGVVPLPKAHLNQKKKNLNKTPDYVDVGNGGISNPETGLNIALSESTIHYGPWADKERFHIYNVLFPSISRDGVPFKKLLPGMRRVYTEFKFRIETINDTIIRIPTKEQSKDHLYINKHHGDKSHINNMIVNEMNEDENTVIRPFGWIELKLDTNSTIEITTSYIPTQENGWKNNLSTNFNSPELRSSVNHDIFFKAGRHTLDADIGYPLKWNGETIWKFQNRSYDADLFLLREHLTLITDLLDDFASGDPTPYQMFRPFHYKINWELFNYGIHLNINERNIIDNPSVFSDNTFMSFQGEDLKLDVNVPLDAIFRKSSTVDFQLSTDYFNLVLLSPPWSTKNNFMPTSELARANNFKVDGSYTFFSAIEIDSVDTVIVNCTCDDTTLKTYGFFIRYILLFKENYFGDHMHFKTLSEFMEEQENENRSEIGESFTRLDSNQEDGTDLEHHDKKDIEYRLINETDVFFSFCVNNGCLILPSHIYDSKSHVALHFQTLDIDIRFTNYYMDMQADFSSINARAIYDCLESDIFDITKSNPEFQPDLFIDGLAVHGHRMFGLPPVEPTYYVRWQFEAGDIAIISNGKFFDALKRSIANIGYTYNDLENQLGIPEIVVYDILNLSFSTPGIKVQFLSEDKNDDYVFEASLDGLDFRLSDQANARYSSRIDLAIENIYLRSFKLSDPSYNILCLQTTLNFTDFVQKRDFEHMRDFKEAHIRLSDGPFHRCPFLISEDYRSGNHGKYSSDYQSIRPSIPIPDVPPPLTKQSVDFVFQELPRGLIEESDNYSEVSSLSDMSYSSRLNLNAFSGHHGTGYNNKSNVKVFNSESGGGTDVHDSDEDTLYQDEDYCPNYQLDKDTEYDSLVLRFGDIRGFLSLPVFKVVENIVRETSNVTIANALDSLNIEIVDYLAEFSKSLCNSLNVVFVSPLIDIYGFDFSKIPIPLSIHNYHKIDEFDHLRLVIEHGSLSLSSKTTHSYDKAQNQSSSNVQNKCVLKFEDFSFGFYKNLQLKQPTGSRCAFKITLDGTEVCFSDIETFLVSLNQDSVEVSVEPEDLHWVQSFIEKIGITINETKAEFERIADDQHKATIELLYLLTTASLKFQIHHDPASITKPSYVTRCTKEGTHIRLRDSWKVVTRLRHIVESLPKQYLREIDNDFSQLNWKAPLNYKEEIMKAFSTWRIWEFADIAKSYIFKYAFHEFEDSMPSTERHPLDLTLIFGSFNLVISPDASKKEFFAIDNLSITFTTREGEIQQVQNFIDLIMKERADSGDNFVSLDEYYDVFLSMDNISSRVGLESLKLKDFINSMISNSESLKDTRNGEILIKQSSDELLRSVLKFVSINLLVKRWKHLLSLKKTHINLEGSQLMMSTNGILSDPEVAVALCVSNQMASLDILADEEVLFHGSYNECAINLLMNGGSLSDAPISIDLSTGSVNLFFDKESSVYISAIDDFVTFDIPIIETLLDNQSHDKKAKIVSITDDREDSKFDPLDLISKITREVSGSIGTSRMDVRLGLLSPIRVTNFANDLRLSFSASQEFVSVMFTASKLNTAVGSSRYNSQFEYVHHNLDKCKFDMRFSLENSILVIDNSWNIESSRTIVLHITDSLRMGYADQEELLQNILAYKKAINRVIDSFDQISGEGDTKQIENQGKSNDESESVGFDFKNSCKLRIDGAIQSVNLLAIQDHAQVLLEIENSAVNLSSFDERLLIHKPHGGIYLPSIKIVYSVAGSPLSRFTVFDSDFQLTVLNPNSKEHDLQNLDVITTHLRFALNPYVMEELITLWFKINRAIDNHKPQETSKITSVQSNGSTANQLPIENILSFFSIRVTARNFCIAWLFESYHANNYHVEFPGIIMGFAESRMLFTKQEGEIATDEAYIANAQGTTASTFFFSNKRAEDANNRAYFPGFLATYNVANSDSEIHFNYNLRGRKVDFRLQTDSFAIAEKLLSSATRIQDALQKHQLTSQKISLKSPFNETFVERENETAVVLKADESETSEQIEVFKKLRFVNCTFQFDGGQMQLLNEHLEIQGEIPSLCLQTPMITITASYNQSTGSINHMFNIEVVASESDNKLLSTCVPVIVEMIKSGRKLMRQTESNNTKKRVSIAASPSFEMTKTSSKVQVQTHVPYDFEFDHIFEKISLNFVLNILPQRLSLSCEPTAKVEAVVATSGINVTANIDRHRMKAAIHVQDLKAELQHVYSRQTSGSVELTGAFLDCALVRTANSRREFTGEAQLDSIAVYINIQQRQDLDLFRDIWLPGEFYEKNVITRPSNAPAVDKTFAARLREVSSTTAFPWYLNALVSRAVARVDIGRSLGLLVIDFDKFSVISKKMVNWDQSAQISLSKVSIHSEGRLGGMIIMNKPQMSSTISWRNNERVTDTLNIPLVSLSLGFENLQGRISLDYHPFFLAEIVGASFEIHNGRIENELDKLSFHTSLKSCSIYLTALTAANFVDIYTAALRIRQDIQLSYREVLHDSAPAVPIKSLKEGLEASVAENKANVAETFLGAIEKLHTKFKVDLGAMKIHIAPSSLLDNQVLLIQLDSARAQFSQNGLNDIEDRLKLQLNHFVVSLSSLKIKPTEASLEGDTVSEYIEFADTASGGNIFVFPSVNISMDVFEKENSNIISHNYACTFGGKVDIKWKLGSVYFIRQMWYSHANSLSTRLTAMRITSHEMEDGDEGNNGHGEIHGDTHNAEGGNENYKSIFETVNIEDRLKTVESDAKFQYVPLSEPIIETPQLKDLGNATPPLEWFGLHRNQFPNLTHQILIVGFQQIVKEAEKRYAEILK